MGGRPTDETPRGVELWRTHTFFTDYNLGTQILPGMLRDHGVVVETHRANFESSEVPDDEWIGLCGRKGWIGLTNDKIRARPLEREIIGRASARVFMIGGEAAPTGEARGRLIIAALPAIGRFLKKHHAPFLVRIGAGGTLALRWPQKAMTRRDLYRDKAARDREQRD